MISLAVAAAGWVGVSSPGDYAAIKFPPVPRHDHVSLFEPFLLRHFRRGYRSIFDVMTLLGVIGITGILAWRVWDLAQYPETTVVLRFPMVWIIGAMAVLAALAIPAAIAAMREEQRPTPPHSPQPFE